MIEFYFGPAPKHESSQHFECDYEWCTVPNSFYVEEKLVLIQGISLSEPLSFRVRAKVEQGWGEWSKEKHRVKSLSANTPAPTLSAVSSTALKVSWKDLPAEDVYGKLVCVCVCGCCRTWH